MMTSHLMKKFVLACLLVANAEGSRTLRSNNVKSTRIVPELKPVEDGHFFGKDFPDDHSPGKSTHFTHPYPELQDDNKYDKDYVHDRDEDGGEWKAQMEYDNLRSKIGHEKWEAEQAAKKEAKEKADVEAARKREEGAEGEAKKAEAEADDAESDEKKAEAAADDGDDLAKAKEELKKAEEGMKKCEERLAEAKAALEALQNKNSTAAAEAGKAKENAEEKKENAAEVEKEEEQAEKSLEQEIKEYEEAKKVAAKEKQDLGKHQADLEAAEDKLRGFRTADNGKHANGGVYSDEKSFPSSWWHWLLIVLGVALLIAVGVYCFMGRGA